MGYLGHRRNHLILGVELLRIGARERHNIFYSIWGEMDRDTHGRGINTPMRLWNVDFIEALDLLLHQFHEINVWSQRWNAAMDNHGTDSHYPKSKLTFSLPCNKLNFWGIPRSNWALVYYWRIRSPIANTWSRLRHWETSAAFLLFRGGKMELLIDNEMSFPFLFSAFRKP
jgi:hypothetical protein